ncbi:hypothetical protein VRU48_17365 [Pedobacter sp. KR3-3]|uniref:Bacteriocin-type signal sequence-containing protein n=1 Tax=Pedobacter albus TaxID=3113905 RepID=A0ABU7ICK6_9SPHI|nr:hypothetical protein [Pedobacter sp. KR3-3]MEE1946899.1 hypothetical protein [Pedobacter sp. KR3-3]
MKKVNLLSKTELKKVMGGGYPPDTPGGDAGYCHDRNKGHALCLEDGGSGNAIEYFFACCETNEDVLPYCPPNSAYTCVTM